MLRKNNRILAIDPGSREMGLAVLDSTELMHYGVKTLKKFRPENVLKTAVAEILLKLVIEYNIKTVVVENGWFSQNRSPLFQAMFAAIEELAKDKRLKLVKLAPKTIRKSICYDGKATKKRTAQVLADQYPELGIYLEQNFRWKEKYWMHVFDALAAGLTYLRQEPGKTQ